ncbi:hypothetical protein EMPG_10699 [Blastomyces silverae]|uniref:Uncharacterized protein n=1 Tax=Blastomyces silverae TaxID=2060906 RepID=A0A0H1B379_9EURO|nr:hypothetical protein EMPG_10699 [Blastomyces silverae]
MNKFQSCNDGPDSNKAAIRPVLSRLGVLRMTSKYYVFGMHRPGYSVAKDRAWFTPFKTEVMPNYGMLTHTIPIVGVGTIELATKCSPNKTD